MAKVFHPRKEIFVSASHPHPSNTQYRVAIGEEEWGGEYIPVLKVQMVYCGEVSGRRSPSYPLGTDDHHRVGIAMEELLCESKDVIKRLVG